MNQEEQNNKRIAYIDALKGFAILCVVFGHVANGQLTDPFTQTAYFFVYNIIYTFHMALFILLSGEVFYHAYCKETSKGGQKGRIGIQIARLSILYFLWSLILGVFRMVFAEAVNTPVSWKDVLLIPVKPIKLYWYLFVLIIFYLFFGILRLARANIWIMLSVTFLLSIGSYFLSAGLCFDIKRVLYYAFFFFTGIVLARNKGKKLASEAQKILLVALLFFVVLSIVLCIIFWTPSRYLNDRLLVNWIIAISFSAGFYVLFQKVRWLGESKLLIYFGKHSLEIYLVHTFILSAVRYLLKRIGILTPGIHLVIGLLCGVMIPLLISFVLRKIHLYNVFFDQLMLLTDRKGKTEKI